MPGVGVRRSVERLERRHDRRIAGRAQRPDGADPRFAVWIVERRGQVRDGFGRQRRIEAADRERQVAPHLRIAVFDSLETP